MAVKTYPVVDSKHWPTEARAAVPHVVGFAEYLWRYFVSWLENNLDPKARLLGEVLALKTEVARLHEEIAIKDGRMDLVAAKRRPHYSPEARLRILALKAARCWSMAATARRFQLAAATVASWVAASADADSSLLKQRQAVNSFPEFVTSIVQQLKATVPLLGRRKVVEYLGRGGLALSASTVARMAKKQRTVPPPQAPEPQALELSAPESSAPTQHVKAAVKARHIISRYPGHVWGMDITLVPTSGFCVPWWPRVLPPIWPFTWHVLLVLDHFSRAVVHTRRIPEESHGNPGS